MGKRANELPEHLGGLFSRADALKAGVSAQRLRRQDVDAVLRGVYRRRPRHGGDQGQGAAHPPADWQIVHLRKAEALSLLMRDKPWFFSGVTAALIWRLPIPIGDYSDLEVAVHAPLRPPQRRGVHGVQVRRSFAEVGTFRGFRVTSAVTTWASLARRLSADDLVAVGDAVVQRPRIPGTNELKRAPFASLDDLRYEAEHRPRAGVRKLREAVELVRVGSASRPETQTRLILARAGLPEPELDFDVFDRAGRLLGCSEIAYPGAKVALEYESEHHRVNRQQWHRDIQKYQHYAEAGWRVVRVTSGLLYQRPDELIRQVREAFA